MSSEPMPAEKLRDLSWLPPGKIDVLYGRFSPRRFAERSESIDNQFHKLRQYARLRELENPVEFWDPELTGDIPFGERPAGATILRLMKERRVASVTATRFDRVFRNEIDIYMSSLRWRELGVTLRLLDFSGQELNLDSPAGRSFIWNLAGLVAFQRSITSEQTSEGMQSRMARGQRMSSRIIYGWREDETGPRNRDGRPTRTLKDPQEQGVIDIIVTLHTGIDRLGPRAIQRKLNDDEILYRGKKWHVENVIRVLTHAGVYNPNEPRNGRFRLTEELQEEYDRVDQSLAVISQTRKKVARRRRRARTPTTTEG